jgi:hypothetical protein
MQDRVCSKVNGSKILHLNLLFRPTQIIIQPSTASDFLTYNIKYCGQHSTAMRVRRMQAHFFTSIQGLHFHLLANLAVQCYDLSSDYLEADGRCELLGTLCTSLWFASNKIIKLLAGVPYLPGNGTSGIQVIATHWIVVKSATSGVRQVEQKFICLAIIAVEWYRVNWNIESILALCYDRFRRLTTYKKVTYRVLQDSAVPRHVMRFTCKSWQSSLNNILNTRLISNVRRNPSKCWIILEIIE